MGDEDNSGANVQADGARLADPPHPGAFLRAEIIQGRGLSVSEAAEALRVLRPTCRPC